MENNIKTISLHKIKELIGTRKNKLNVNNNDSFYFVKESNKEYYVEPLLSYIESGINSEYNKSNIILISAPGATGKSEMTKNLSFELNIPVFDLGQHDAVGANSFIGMLYKTISPMEMGRVLTDLTSGQYSIIIDALDEGLTRTKSAAAFEAFLKDIADIAKQSSGLPFIIFGRTSVLEYATLFFEDKGIKVSLLQIEPFTLEQAKRFVDNCVKRHNINIFDKAYKDVRDKILDCIKGFFKSEGEIKNKLYEGFIGYAPVLQSIAKLIISSNNLIDLYNQLNEANEKGIMLIKKIIETILNREREKLLGKEGEQGLLSKDLLANRDEQFKTSFKAKAYDINEQYIRLLYKCLDESFHSSITNDEEFNKEYDKNVLSWENEHPFRDNDKNKIVNVVFEAFVLVELMSKDEYSDKVLNYLKNKGNGSYMLYNIFKLTSGYSSIDCHYLPYLIESFQSLDRGESRGKVEITSLINDINDDNISLEIDFSRDGDELELNTDKEYTIKTTIPKNEYFVMPKVISNIYIDADELNVEMSNITTEFSAPVNIAVKNVKMSSKEFQFRTFDKNNNNIVIECDNFESRSLFDGMQSVYTIGKVDIKIISTNTVFFPFVKYKQDTYDKKNDKEEAIFDKYQKMRRTILHFHSYKGGELAKYKTKIDNRIGSSSTGKKVLNALIKTGIIIEDGMLYKINKTKLDEFGIDFNKIRSTEINGKLEEFLKKI